MASQISARPSHYDALGISPSASQDEIARAFGKAMGLFGAHSAAAAAQLGIAFETLRNPEKRRTYDEAIGLRRSAAPVAAPMAVSFRISARPPASEPHVERAPEPAPASSIASSLREIARPVDVNPSRRPAVQAAAAQVQPPVAAIWEEEYGEAEDRPIDWRRPVVAVGAVVFAAGLVGALVGVSVKADEQGQAAVTTALPPAKPRPQVALPVEPAMTTGAAAAPVEQAVRARHAEVRPQHGAPETSASPDIEPASESDAAPAAETAAADPLAPQADSTIEAVAAAGLPVATKLVARTIDKIGYRCGQVASTSAVEGTAGVYKVTCTSGQSYRAAPVHGRYRFRRWDSR